jgi:hypothetical protein
MYGGNRGDLRQMTEEVARRWVGRFLDQDPAWIIEAGTLIGHVRLDHVDLKDKRASLAIGIDDSTQLGKGLSSELLLWSWGCVSMFSSYIESPCEWWTTIWGHRRVSEMRVCR